MLQAALDLESAHLSLYCLCEIAFVRFLATDDSAAPALRGRPSCAYDRDNARESLANPTLPLILPPLVAIEALGKTSAERPSIRADRL